MTEVSLSAYNQDSCIVVDGVTYPVCLQTPETQRALQALLTRADETGETYTQLDLWLDAIGLFLGSAARDAIFPEPNKAATAGILAVFEACQTEYSAQMEAVQQAAADVKRRKMANDARSAAEAAGPVLNLIDKLPTKLLSGR